MTFPPQDGNLSIIDFQVAAANKALGSVSELVDAGRRIISDAEVSHFENAQGHKTKMRRSNGIWYLDCRHVPHNAAKDPNGMSKPFDGQAKRVRR